METIIEKTIVKLNLKPIKDLIKTYVEKQKFYKRQRKSDKTLFKERQIEQWEAQYKAHENGINLRIMYLAYGLLRGKSFSQVEQNYDEKDICHFINMHIGKIEKTLEGFKQMSKIKEE